VDRVFLDANVLFSAAWREASGLMALWDRAGIKLLTSAYAVEEARINLRDAEQRSRLTRLIERVEVISAVRPVKLPPGVDLPDKDLPILYGATQASASHLITGDKEHFGQYFGRTIIGIRILPPAQYLQRK
jgi:predicted nucleic acid-binding protein